jgi:anti-anti-sigma factor
VKTLLLQKLIYFTAINLSTPMNVKIDTKEKFTVLTVEEQELPANMTEELLALLLPYHKMPVPHIILNLSAVQNADITVAGMLVELQESFYEKNCSFVICGLQPKVAELLDAKGWLELLNVTPTESEAWDIVQMEEIERELMDNFEDD